MSTLNRTLRQSSNLFLFVLALALLMLAQPLSAAQTQPDVDELAGLAVELWPDYDQADMLVLLTGVVPPDTPLPVTVTIPLPATAELNAVARVTADNRLIDDIEYEVSGSTLRLTSPDPQFHVEYYDPYVVNGNDRTYRFEWLSDMLVAQLSTAVQEPFAATSMRIDPEPVNSGTSRGDGLQYSTLASQVVPAGDLYAVDVAWTMESAELSAPALAENPSNGLVTADLGSASDAAAPNSGTVLDGGISIWWIAGIFGVAALVGLAFFFGRQQSGTRSGATRKPKPNRPAPAPPSSNPRPAAAPKPAPPPSPAAAARYCHQCGEPAAADDRFCSNCGTKLKTVG